MKIAIITIQSHNHDITEEMIGKFCKEHENDSRLF